MGSLVKIVMSVAVLVVIAAASGFTPGAADPVDYKAKRDAAKAVEHAAEADRQNESDAIQFCRDSIFERFRPTGGISFDMGGTNYSAKGYGALVVGTGRTSKGRVRFKCVFEGRVLTDIQVTSR